jgi:RNA polymerase sigma-70 factor (ECF subfamily)
MGRAYLINRIKREQRNVFQEDEITEKEVEQQMIEQYEFSLGDSEILVKTALLRIGEKCRELLKLFFYHNYSIQNIMEKMNYKNENVVSSHKSRCIKQLKEILKDKD